MKRLLLLALACAGWRAAAANALPLDWTYQPHTKSLVGMVREDEGDYSFHADCRSPAKIMVGIGAQTGVGKGDGERVTVILTSAARKIRIDGRSGKSPNFEMTGALEFQTNLAATHPIFVLLADRGPVKVSGDLNETWPEAGRRAALQKFLAACR